MNLATLLIIMWVTVLIGICFIVRRLNAIEKKIIEIYNNLVQFMLVETKHHSDNIETLDIFMVNPKKGNAILDKIHKEQQHDNEKFYCECRDYDVTYRKTCKNCMIASIDEDENFYCPYYKQ